MLVRRGMTARDGALASLPAASARYAAWNHRSHHYIVDIGGPLSHELVTTGHVDQRRVRTSLMGARMAGNRLPRA
jgi:hypothetical protein